MGQKKRQQLEAINGVPVDKRTGLIPEERRPEAGLTPSADLAQGTPPLLAEAAQRGLPATALAPRSQVQNARAIQNIGLQQQDLTMAAEIERQRLLESNIGGGVGLQNLQDIGAGSLANQPLPDPTTGGQVDFGPAAAVGGAAGAIGGIAAASGGAAIPVIGGTLAASAAAGPLLVGAAGAGAVLTPILIAEQREKVSVYNQQTADMPANMQAIINRVNLGGDKQQAYAEFLELTQQSLVNEANLKAETQNEVTKFLGGPGKEYQRITNFNKNILPTYALKLEEAIRNPNPANNVDLSIYQRSDE